MKTQFNHNAESAMEAIGLPADTKPAELVINRVIRVIKADNVEDIVMTDEEKLATVFESLNKIPAGVLLRHTNKFEKVSQVVEWLCSDMTDEDFESLFNMLANPVAEAFLDKFEEMGI